MNDFRTRIGAAFLMTLLVGCDGGSSATGPAGATPAPEPPPDLKAKFERPGGKKAAPAPTAPAPAAEKKG